MSTNLGLTTDKLGLSTDSKRFPTLRIRFLKRTTLHGHLLSRNFKRFKNFCKAVVWCRWCTGNTTIYSPDSILTHATLIFFFLKYWRDLHFNEHLLTRIFKRLISYKCSVEVVKKTKLCELHPTKGNSFQNEAVQYSSLPVSRVPKQNS